MQNPIARSSEASPRSHIFYSAARARDDGPNVTQAQRVFVIAAHPDDDVIGCGGFISQVTSAGGAVCVAYLTDGSQSHPGSRQYPPRAIAALRTQEARAALRVLGVTVVPLFLELADGKLSSLDAGLRASVVASLTRAIEAFDADVVLAPWLRDPHPDHAAASLIAADAVASLRRRPVFEGYEVWLQIRGVRAEFPQPGETTTREVVLSPETIERKRRSIVAHRSQTSRMIDDDPTGFYIDETLLQRWLEQYERFHTMPIPPVAR